MKSVLISIRPEWVEKIVNWDKTIEVRKSAPTPPFKAYIYCTKDKPYLYRVDDDNNFELTNTLHPKTYEYVKDYNEQNGKVIGEFICDKVYNIEYLPKEYEGNPSLFPEFICNNSCLSFEQIMEYKNGKTLYGWHISDLKIYDKPKESSEFRAYNFKSMNGTDVCGNYDCKYYQDSGSYMIPPSCAKNGCRITHPPQSYMFVEEVIR